jgi:opine dehydrogenase
MVYGKRLAILGAGHAGRGLAGYLSLHGFNVSLYNRTYENVKGIARNGGIEVHGVIEGHASIPIVTSEMELAIKNRDIIIVTVPAQAHTFYANELAPHFKPDQLILLMPGRTGGALEFSKILRYHSNVKEISLGEAQTYIFVSRTTGPSSVLISKIKNKVSISAFPAVENRRFIRRLAGLPLRLELANDVLETSLNNIGAMLHPTPTILCAGLLESRCGGYNHYLEAISRTIGTLIERMDAERVDVARSFYVPPLTLLDWLKQSYDAKGDTLYECIRSIDAYKGVGCPSTLQHRYVLEDIPTGLVPISYLGKLSGIKTPVIDSVVDIASQLYQTDFWSVGRKLRCMGLNGMTIPEVIEYVQTGIRPVEYAQFLETRIASEVEVDRI